MYGSNMQRKGEKEKVHGHLATIGTKESGVTNPHMLNQTMMWSGHIEQNKTKQNLWFMW
jgi:hypothetical protein